MVLAVTGCGGWNVPDDSGSELDAGESCGTI